MKIFNCDNDTCQWALILGDGNFILRDTEEQLREIIDKHGEFLSTWQILAPGEKSGDAAGFEAARAATKTRASQETPLADFDGWIAARKAEEEARLGQNLEKMLEKQAQWDALTARAQRIYAECGGNPDSLEFCVFSFKLSMDMDDAALAEAARQALGQPLAPKP